LQVEYVGLEDVRGYARNSKTHPQKQIDAIKASIEQFGFNNPLLVDSTGEIVAGHGRLEAAKQLGLTKLPVIRLGHLNDVQKRAYVIADNKLAESAEWDLALLAEELAKIQEDGIDISLTGFTTEELEVLQNRSNFDWDSAFNEDQVETDFTQQQERKAKNAKPVTCPHCQKEFVPGA
jgi:ParB-like chromosome segregation protein Spo0J